MNAFVYPERPDQFAWQFMRLLTYVNLSGGLTFGPDGYCLLVVIALREDDAKYSRPVAISDGELMVLCGLSTRKRFERARTKAVETGWLRYQEPTTGVPTARYYVSFPGSYQLSDGNLLQDAGDAFGEEDTP
jgi:hypothetical protein